MPSGLKCISLLEGHHGEHPDHWNLGSFLFGSNLEYSYITNFSVLEDSVASIIDRIVSFVKQAQQACTGY